MSAAVSKIYTAAERKQMESLATSVAVRSDDALAKLSDATRMLAEIHDAPSAKRVMDMASVAEQYAKRLGLGIEAERYAAGIKLDAQRVLGEHLKQTPNAPHGGRPDLGSSSVPKSSVPTLSDLGISKKLSSESQRIADLDDETYESLRVGEITKSKALATLRAPKEEDPFHLLVESGHLRDAITRLVDRWPSDQHRHIPSILREVADEMESQ